MKKILTALCSLMAFSVAANAYTLNFPITGFGTPYIAGPDGNAVNGATVHVGYFASGNAPGIIGDLIAPDAVAELRLDFVPVASDTTVEAFGNGGRVVVEETNLNGSTGQDLFVVAELADVGFGVWRNTVLGDKALGDLWVGGASDDNLDQVTLNPDNGNIVAFVGSYGEGGVFQMAQVGVIPEPSTYAALMGLLAGLFVIRRRRK